MAEETKKTYTIRLPEQLAGRVEAQAASVNVTPTSHSSQGATVDRVIVNIDTMRSAELSTASSFMFQSAAPGMVSASIQRTESDYAKSSVGAARSRWPCNRCSKI